MISAPPTENTETALGATEVAALLDEMARRLELVGVSKFKVRAYENAANSLRTLLEPLDELIAEQQLKTIPGVGDAIAEKIEMLHRTGTHPSLEQLREQGPAGLLDLVRIPGVGPRRAKALFEKLNIKSLDELRAACVEDRLATATGFGIDSGALSETGRDRDRRRRAARLRSLPRTGLRRDGAGCGCGRTSHANECGAGARQAQSIRRDAAFRDGVRAAFESADGFR